MEEISRDQEEGEMSFMSVDIEVEPAVRIALEAAVDQESASLERALARLQEYGDRAVVLALDIARALLIDIFDGFPDSEQIRDLGEAFRRMEVWFQSDRVPVEDFIRAVSGDREVVLDSSMLLVTGVLVDAWLLASYANEGQPWWQYLNQVLDVIEAQS